MDKVNVLLLQESIVAYRLPIYNIIAKEVNLTVAYTDKSKSSGKDLFKVIKLDKTSFKGFHIITSGFQKLCNKFDVVIFMADLHYLSYCLLPFKKRSFKAIPWTIGIRASYTRLYDVNRQKDTVDKVYSKILKKSDAIIFYMETAKEFWKEILPEENIFIAHNTVETLGEETISNKVSKTKVLFVGTLYKEKKIYELIEAFQEAKKDFKLGCNITLDIIGDGEEYANIKQYISDHSLEDSVFLHGAIYDEYIIQKYFRASLLCVSPNQAGLSVLKSMGYGVPFVTRTNAITGGERDNIESGVTGIFYNNINELKELILDASVNPDFYVEMGERAYKYYQENATPQIMANGVLEAIKYSLKKGNV